MEGKIIAITGGPRTGKSTLAKLLSKELNAHVILEGEEHEIPKDIINFIQEDTHHHEVISWFREKLVQTYEQALKLKKQGKTVVLDTFWETNSVYIDTWVTDPLQKAALMEEMRQDRAHLPWPDLVIALHTTQKELEEFSRAGDRSFDQGDAFLQRQVALNDAHRKHFSKIQRPNMLFLERAGVDYYDPATLRALAELVKKHLEHKQKPLA